MDLSKRDRPNIFAGIGSSRAQGLGAHWHWVAVLGLAVGVAVVATAMHSGLKAVVERVDPNLPPAAGEPQPAHQGAFREPAPDFTKLAAMDPETLSRAWDDIDKPGTCSDIEDQSGVAAHIFQFLRSRSSDGLAAVTDSRLCHSDLVRSPEELRGRVLGLTVRLMRKHQILSLSPGPSGVRDVSMLFCYGHTAIGTSGTFVLLVPKPPDSFQDKAEYRVTGVFMKRYPYLNGAGNWQWQPMVLALDMAPTSQIGKPVSTAAAPANAPRREAPASAAKPPEAYKVPFRPMDAQFTPAQSLDAELLQEVWDDPMYPEQGNALGGEVDVVAHIYQFMRSHRPEELAAMVDHNASHNRILLQRDTQRGKIFNLRVLLLRKYQVLGWPENKSGVRDTSLLFCYGQSSPSARGKFVVLVPKPLEAFEENRIYDLNGVFMKLYAIRTTDERYEWQPLILTMDMTPVPAPAARPPALRINYATVGIAVFGGLLIFFVLRQVRAPRKKAKSLP
jgi:hypothetical protein